MKNPSWYEDPPEDEPEISAGYLIDGVDPDVGDLPEILRKDLEKECSYWEKLE